MSVFRAPFRPSTLRCLFGSPLAMLYSLHLRRQGSLQSLRQLLACVLSAEFLNKLVSVALTSGKFSVFTVIWGECGMNYVVSCKTGFSAVINTIIGLPRINRLLNYISERRVRGGVDLFAHCNLACLLRIKSCCMRRHTAGTPTVSGSRHMKRFLKFVCRV